MLTCFFHFDQEYAMRNTQLPLTFKRAQEELDIPSTSRSGCVWECEFRGPVSMDTWGDLERAAIQYGKKCVDNRSWEVNFYQKKTKTPTETPFEYWFFYGDHDSNVLKFRASDLCVPGLMRNREWYSEGLIETVSTVDDAKRCGSFAQKAGSKHVAFFMRDKKTPKTTTSSSSPPIVAPTETPFGYWFHFDDKSITKFNALTLRIPDLVRGREWRYNTYNAPIVTVEDAKRYGAYICKGGDAHVSFYVHDKTPSPPPTAVAAAAAAPYRWYGNHFTCSIILALCVYVYVDMRACFHITMIALFISLLAYVPAAFRAIDTYADHDNMVTSLVRLKLGARKQVWAVCDKHKWKTDETISELLLAKQKK